MRPQPVHMADGVEDKTPAQLYNEQRKPRYDLLMPLAYAPLAPLVRLSFLLAVGDSQRKWNVLMSSHDTEENCLRTVADPNRLSQQSGPTRRALRCARCPRTTK